MIGFARFKLVVHYYQDENEITGEEWARKTAVVLENCSPEEMQKELDRLTYSYRTAKVSPKESAGYFDYYGYFINGVEVTSSQFREEYEIAHLSGGKKTHIPLFSRRWIRRKMEPRREEDLIYQGNGGYDKWIAGLPKI